MHDAAYSADIIGGDIFFEIIEPSELEYTYRIRPAKDFGAPFVSSKNNLPSLHLLHGSYVLV